MRTLNTICLNGSLSALVCGAFLLAPVLVGASRLLARGPDVTQQWQGRALAEFPALGVPGSPFNRLFLGRVRQLREKRSALLQDPSWPYRLARQIAESPELAHANATADWGKTVAETSGAAVGVVGSQTVPKRNETDAGSTEKSLALAELCVHAVDAELASGAIKEERGAWIREGHIAPRLRLRALRSAKVISEAAYTDLLQRFLQQVLQAPGDLGEEDLNWVKAFLAAEEAHAAFAGLFGVSEIQLVEALLAKADSPGFTLDWIGGGSGGFVPPMKIHASRRLEILERVFAGQFQLGGMPLSKEACQEMCFRINSEAAGGGFLLLENRSVRDFPEVCFINSNAPASKFSPLKGEWAAYMRSVVQMLGDLKNGRFLPFSTYFPACSGTGGFEQFVVWESLRKESPREAILWLDSLAQELYKHSGLQAREARRVLPAINYVLAQLAAVEDADTRASAPPVLGTAAADAARKPVQKPASRPVTVSTSGAVSVSGKNPSVPAQSAKATRAGTAAK
jgi:hypothetical protein